MGSRYAYSTFGCFLGAHFREEYRRSQLELPANLLLIAGIGYFAVGPLNTRVDTGGRPVLSRQVVLTSAGLVGAGLLIKGISRGFKVDKARIGEK